MSAAPGPSDSTGNTRSRHGRPALPNARSTSTPGSRTHALRPVPHCPVTRSGAPAPLRRLVARRRRPPGTGVRVAVVRGGGADHRHRGRRPSDRSGLGCPTWPRCTPDSLVNTPEMGIHGVIEFGNRTLTGLVGILAIAVVVLVWRMRHERRVLFVLSLVVLVGIVAQAVVGGITVLTGLNPFIVGSTTSRRSRWWPCAPLPRADVSARRSPHPRRPALVRGSRARHHRDPRPDHRLRRAHHRRRPHSGDEASIRNGFDAQVLEHVTRARVRALRPHPRRSS